MTRHRLPRYCLSSILTLVLAVATTGCCGNVDDEETEESHAGIVADEVLVEIRENNATDEERCDAACTEILERDGITPDEVLTCDATVDDSNEMPWDPSHEAVDISCTVRFTTAGFCTGRRPQGHREVDASVDGVGRWFAVHAHLERASVTAFAELAVWLAAREAPRVLVERCRAAAADEVLHAELMAEHAALRGASVPACEAEAMPDDLLAVAIHNAVEGCVHESFAAIIATHQAAHARADLGRADFARIAGDELRHGQLAWDLHCWLVAQLDDDARAIVEQAQREAFACLPARAAANARMTPDGLGWPAPAEVSRMASRFASLMAAAA